MSNAEIAKLLKNVAAAYTITNEAKHRFQIIAYQKAADAVEHSSIELKDLYKDHSLDKLPGIGASIQAHLEELFTTGHVKHFDSILSQVPESVFPLLDVPSFGPKKAYKLVSHFKIKSAKTVLSDVEKLATNGQIRELEGFGEKSEEDILRALSEYKAGTTKSGRMVLPYAYALAERLIEYMKKSKDVIHIDTLGSLRRRVSTIGDVDIALTSHNPERAIDFFCAYPAKERVIERGPTSASLLVSGGKHIDLLVLNPDMWGSLLQHFTGSKHHNVALREYALKKGWSLSERGIKLIQPESYKLKAQSSTSRKTPVEGKLITFKTEQDFYKYMAMDWIPPEIRENQGEIDAALNHRLPNLVELADVKGDLHIHSNYPIESSHDYGNASMQNMLDRAKELMYEYLGFSEHNPKHMDMSKQKLYDLLKKRQEKIEQLNSSNKNIRVINLLEVDILASGSLALDDKATEFVDGMIVSIHSSFATPKEKMTKRVLAGLSHPKAKIFAHPTGRLINNRPGYELEWDKIFDFAVTNNKALEINAWPERLDLPDVLVRAAKEKGVKFVIDTDSHAIEHMDNMFYGVAVARRGWCEKEDILNTLSHEQFTKWLKT